MKVRLIKPWKHTRHQVGDTVDCHRRGAINLVNNGMATWLDGSTTVYHLEHVGPMPGSTLDPEGGKKHTKPDVDNSVSLSTYEFLSDSVLAALGVEGAANETELKTLLAANFELTSIKGIGKLTESYIFARLKDE